nr:MAG TPA: periplasmic protein [Caudoviricetes sp.]
MEEYTQLTLDDWLEMKENLKRDLIGVQESFVRIGYTLRTIEEQELYKRDGYETITEFAKAEYGLSASTISRFININRKFSVAGYSDRLRPEFAKIGSSKLSEMLSLPDADLEMVRPEMPKADIRELKHFNKEEPVPEAADSLEKLVWKFFEVNAAIAKELEQSEAYADGEAEKMVEIVNPAGVKTFRAGLYYMAMYENDIQIKQFGQQPQKMSWAEFFAITKKIFESVEWKQRIQEEHPKTEPQEKVETKPIAPAQIKKPESPINTEAEPVLETPKKPEKETSQNAAQKKNEAPQSEEPRKPEEKVQSEPEIAENGAESTQNAMEITQNATETAQTETEEQLPGQMNLPEDYPGTESIDVLGKTMQRKEYLDTLTAWGVAEYLHKNLTAEILGNREGLYEWLKGKVDERGYGMEDVNVL